MKLFLRLLFTVLILILTGCNFLKKKEAVIPVLKSPVFSLPSDTYLNQRYLTLTPAEDLNEVYYAMTSQQGEPGLSEFKRCTTSLLIDKSCYVYAYAAQEGCIPSPVVYQQYVIQSFSSGTMNFTEPGEFEVVFPYESLTASYDLKGAASGGETIAGGTGLIEADTVYLIRISDIDGVELLKKEGGILLLKASKLTGTGTGSMTIYYSGLVTL
jgi:hypothetical protein